MDIGRGVVLALHDRKMKKQELAKKMGVSQARVTQLCVSKVCTTDTLEKISDCFEMDVAKFIELCGK